jgi:hypothetical protein
MTDTMAPTFTQDWFSRHADGWRTHLGHLVAGGVDYLELGSFEGRSARFICELLPKASVTCVDFWPPGMAGPEANFDLNMGPFAHRVRKIKGRSGAVLDQLWSEQARFDVIYVDANHERWYAFADAVLAWPLLRESGIMIFDDYMIDMDKPRDQRCKDAIDVFHRTFAECMTVLSCRWQVIVRKNSDWPESTRPRLSKTGRPFKQRIRGELGNVRRTIKSAGQKYFPMMRS